jgi:hypothetical protein
MLEVLVSMLATTAFVMGTLQAMVINTIFQVRAEREAQATFWIQEDMEKIKAIAEMSPFDDPLNAAGLPGFAGNPVDPCWDGTGERGFDKGYGGQLRDYLSTNFSQSGDANSQIVEKRPLVNKGYILIRQIEGVTPSGAQDADDSPDVLRVTYTVREAENDNLSDYTLRTDDGKGFSETLATVYTEVIPSGTFNCDS